MARRKKEGEIMQEFNFTELQTITKFAGFGTENSRYCFYCGAQRINGEWRGGEPDETGIGADRPRQQRFQHLRHVDRAGGECAAAHRCNRRYVTLLDHRPSLFSTRITLPPSVAARSGPVQRLVTWSDLRVHGLARIPYAH